MDPDACLTELLDALKDKDRGMARARLSDLYQWVVMDGFLPKDPRTDTPSTP